MIKSFFSAVSVLVFACLFTIQSGAAAKADPAALPVAASVGLPVVLDPTDAAPGLGSDLLYPAWSWETRPATSVADFSDATVLRPVFTPDVSGSWTAKLELFADPADTTPVAMAFLDISTENLAPVALIQARGLPGGSAPLTLDGTPSFDVDGETLTYLWSIVSAPAGHTAVFSATDAAIVDFSYDVAGSYIVGLTVQDASGLTSETAEFRIDVAGASDFDLDATLGTFNLVTNLYSGNQEVEGRTFIGSDLQGVTGQFGYAAPADGTAYAELYIDGSLQNSTINLTPGDEARISGTASNSNVNNGVLVENATDLPAFDFQNFRDQSAFLAGLTGEAANLSDQNNKRFGGPPNAVQSEATFGPNTRIVEASLQDLQSGGYSIDLSQANTVIINVSGTSGSFQMNPLGGTGFAEQVIWNFYEATNINVNSVIVGHVLAPYARMSGFAGSSEGSVIADEVQLTNGELHQQSWLGQVPVAPGQAGGARAVAPVADLSFDQLGGSINEDLLIEPFASTDIDGGPLSSNIAVVSAPAGASPSLTVDENGVGTFSGDLPGDYLIELSVSDGLRTGFDQLLVQLGTGNTRPGARIVPLSDATVGTLSTLDGTQSFDLDGDLLSYRWALLSAPLGSAPVLGSTASPRATLIPDLPGLYVVQLIANDGTADSMPATFPIVVGSPLPIAEAGRDALPDANGQAFLDGTTSVEDLPGYTWSLLGLSGSGSAIDNASIAAPLLTLPAATQEMRVAVQTQPVYQINRSDLGGLCTYDTRLPLDIANPGQTYWHGIAFWANGVTNDGTGRPVWVIDNQRDFTRTIELIDTTGVSRGTYIVPGRVRAYVTTDALPSGAQIRVFLDGNQINQQSPATYTFNRTDAVCSGAGTSLAQLIVSDANGVSLPDTVFVGETNLRPVLTQAANVLAGGGAPVTLFAPAQTYDANGDPITYEWSLIHRPVGSTATIDADPTVAKVAGDSVDFTADRPGLYLIQLEASDGAFAAVPAVFAIVVENDPPVAAAETPSDTFVNDAATLDGSASFDPNGDAITYNWTIVSAPSGSAASIPDPFAAMASLTPDLRGTYVFELEVADFESSDTVQVTLNVPNRAPIAVLEGPTSVAPGVQEQFSALGSSDPDNDPLTYTFALLASPSGSAPQIAGQADGVAGFTADVPGDYVLEVTVSDGLDEATATIDIAAAALNSAPILDDLNAVYTVELGLELALDLVGTDPDGDPISYFATPLPLETGITVDAQSGEVRFRPEAGQLGSYSFTVGVSDGALTDDALLNIEVVAASAGDTAVFGRVLDAVDFASGIETPLANMPVRLSDAALMTTTDASGNFSFGNLSSGSDRVFVEPSANGGPGGYLAANRAITITENQNRDLSPDFLLTPLNDGCATVVAGAPTLLTGTNSGVSVTIPADTILTDTGALYTGDVCLASLPQLFDQPGLPDGTQACNIYGIEASSATFSQGLTLSAPNNDLLPEGTRLNLHRLNGTIGKFQVVSDAFVDAGGTTVSASPSNYSEGTLFTFLPQSPQSVASSDQPTGNRYLSVFEGDLNEVYTLPGYRAFNTVQQVGLSYHSQSANPTIVVAGDVTIADDASLPVTLETSLAVGGLSIEDKNAWTPRAGLDGSTPSLVGEEVSLRQSAPIDASGLDSGRYDYDFRSVAQYACSSVASAHSAEFYVQNQSDSPYGTGWSIDDLQQLIVSTDGSVAIIDDDGVATFDPLPTLTEFEDDPLVFPAVGPQGLVSGDFDGNGEIDIAFGETGTGDINFIYNFGSRDLQNLTSFNVANGVTVPQTGGYPPNLTTIDAGDLNNDGILDIAYGTQIQESLGFIAGDGLGNFSNQTRFSGARDVLDIEVVDIDGDGFDDIVYGTSIFTFFNLFDRIEIWVDFGGPNSRSNVRVADPDHSSFLQLQTGDYDDDGRIDIVHRSRSDDVNIVGNLGNRNFIEGFRSIGDNGSDALGNFFRLADFNGDRLLDIVWSGRDRLEIYLNDGSNGRIWALGSSLARPPSAGNEMPINIADANGDGIDDVVVWTGSEIAVYQGNGDGSFAPFETGLVNYEILDQLVVDVDGDGSLDLISTQRFSTTVHFSKPSSDGRLVSGDGEFSELTKLADGTWTRRYKNGIVVEFDANGLQTATVDPQGNRVSFTYGSDGRLETKTDQVGGVTAFAYRADGRLNTVTYPDGRVTTFDYDDVGNLTEVVEPTGSLVSFAYDETGRLVNTTNQNGNATTYTFDNIGNFAGATLPDGSSVNNQVASSLGLVDGLGGPAAQPLVFVNPEDRVTTVTDRKGQITTVEVNQFGSIVRVVDPLGRTTLTDRNSQNLVTRVERPSDTIAGGTRVDTVAYDSLGNVTQMIEAVGTSSERSTSYAYEPVFNQVVSTTDADGFVMSYEYDAFGEATKIIDGELGERLFSYTPEGQLLSRTDENGNTSSFAYNANLNLDQITYADGSLTAMLYDGSGNAAIIAEAAGTPIERQIQRTYDALNRVLTVEVTGADGAQIDGITTYTYEPNGNLSTVTDETGLVTTMGYDELERLTSVDDPAEGLITRTYNLAGEVTEHTNGDGETHIYVYDDVSRLIQTTDPGGFVKSFAYDVRDNISTVTDGRGGLTAFGYDALDRMTTRTNPIGQTMIRAYDGRDNLTSLTREDGLVETASYDGLSRRIQVVTPDNTLTYAYDPRSNLTEAADDDSRVTFTYDTRNRLETTTTDGTVGPQPEVTLTYTYDALDRRTSMSDSLGGTTLYDWDAEDRLTDLTAPWGTVYSFGYDGEGRRTSLTSTSGRNSTYGYTNGLLSSLSHIQSGVALTDLNYEYDIDGQLTAIVDNLDPSASKAISYDQLNRLVQVAEGVPVAQGGVPIPVEDYAYDEEGNRTASHFSALYASNAHNQLTEDDTYTYAYDLKGNRVSRTDKASGEVETYTYDSQNRLVGYASPTTTASYAYDALERRIAKTVDGSSLVLVSDYSPQSFLNANNYLMEFSNGDLLRRWVYSDSIDEALGYELYSGLGTPGSGTPFEVFGDRLRSATQVFDSAAGVLVRDVSYDSFGNTDVSTEPFQLGFTGRRFDAESELQDNRMRMYDPLVGSFIQADPIGFIAGPLNVFSYVNNDPANLLDPSGLSSARLRNFASGIAAASVTSTSTVALGVANLTTSTNVQLLALGSLMARHSNQIGKAAENAVRFDFPRAAQQVRFFVNGRMRFADLNAAAQRALIEVKDVARLSNTQQLKDYVAYAQHLSRTTGTNWTVQLYVRNPLKAPGTPGAGITKLSRPLEEAIKAGHIVLRRIP